VLGIEDLGDAPPNGAAGSGEGGSENGGSSGADASMGGKSTGGRASGTGNVSGVGGTATGGRNNGGTGGASLPDGSVPDADGSAGAGGLGGGGAGGATGGAGGQNTGGAGGVTGSTVTGKVIDYWGHPIPDVIVTIGTDQATTGAQGQFTIDNVPATYDVSLVTSWVFFDNVNAGWMYQGLTRRDPTLQMYLGIADRRGEIYADTTGVDFSLTDQVVAFGWASPDGTFNGTLDSATMDNLYYFYWYSGLPTNAGTAHLLRWTLDANGVPSTYNAYDTAALIMNDSLAGTPTYQLPNASPAIATKTVTGNVTGSAVTRENHVYQRFTDGAAIPLYKESPATGSYSYKVPALQNGFTTVAAVDGDLDYGYLGISVAHDDITTGTQANLVIPGTPKLLLPVNNSTTVDNTTDLQWSSAGTGVFVFTIWVDHVNTGNVMYVVTTANKVKVPSFPSYSVPPGVENEWFVEQHSSATTVDEAAGPNGFLDSFAYGSPQGPRRGPGTYAESAHRFYSM
jgi:hypothetical protein